MFQFFNVPLNSSRNDVLNPWRMQAVLPRFEHIAVKLDIDTPVVENQLIEQLLREKEIYGRIDEFFFEHHVPYPEMKEYWGEQVSGKLADTYRIFTELREKGIWAHNWP